MNYASFASKHIPYKPETSSRPGNVQTWQVHIRDAASDIVFFQIDESNEYFGWHIQYLLSLLTAVPVHVLGKLESSHHAKHWFGKYVSISWFAQLVGFAHVKKEPQASINFFLQISSFSCES